MTEWAHDCHRRVGACDGSHGTTIRLHFYIFSVIFHLSFVFYFNFRFFTLTHTHTLSLYLFSSSPSLSFFLFSASLSLSLSLSLSFFSLPISLPLPQPLFLSFDLSPSPSALLPLAYISAGLSFSFLSPMAEKEERQLFGSVTIVILYYLCQNWACFSTPNTPNSSMSTYPSRSRLQRRKNLIYRKPWKCISALVRL